MSPDPILPSLTIESLARAIHDDAARTYEIVTGSQTNCLVLPDGSEAVWSKFDSLSPKYREIRMVQARLMFERIMR